MAFVEKEGGVRAASPSMKHAMNSPDRPKWVATLARRPSGAGGGGGCGSK